MFGYVLPGFLYNIDQRYFQIAFLFGLFVFANSVIGINHTIWSNLLLVFGSAVVTQIVLCKYFDVTFCWHSAAVSSLGIAILLHTPYWFMYVFAAVVAISSKFVLRLGNRHIFNPANIGLVAATFLFPVYAVITPTQWNNVAVFSVIAVFICGLLVTATVKRYDTALLFIGTLLISSGLLFTFGVIDSFAVLSTFTSVHTIMFAFFMITDPMTSPNTIEGRLLYVILCVALGVFIQYQFNWNPGFVYALPIANMLVPVFNTFFKGDNFSWRKTG